MKTIIQTRIEGDCFHATTPHAPSLSAEHATEAGAVNRLIAAIRAYRRPFEAAGQPVPWEATPAVADDPDTITRRLSGLWPSSAEPLTPSTPGPDRPAPDEESDHGED